MRICRHYIPVMLTEPEASGLTLAELSAASGQEPRTIRSWIAQGLLPPPRNRGPAARYPAETLQRLLAIVVMRESMGMSLADIRLDLLSATPDSLDKMARRIAEVPAKANRPAADPRDALDYLAALKGAPALRGPEVDQPGVARVESPMAPSLDAPPPSSSRSGLDGLEQRLGGPKPTLQRRSRVEEWLRIPITPDLELSARGPLGDEQKAQLDRIAALIRTIITGG